MKTLEELCKEKTDDELIEEGVDLIKHLADLPSTDNPEGITLITVSPHFFLKDLDTAFTKLVSSSYFSRYILAINKPKIDQFVHWVDENDALHLYTRISSRAAKEMGVERDGQ